MHTKQESVGFGLHVHYILYYIVQYYAGQYHVISLGTLSVAFIIIAQNDWSEPPEPREPGLFSGCSWPKSAKKNALRAS